MGTEKLDTEVRQEQLAQAALSLITSQGLKGSVWRGSPEEWGWSLRRSVATSKAKTNSWMRYSN